MAFKDDRTRRRKVLGAVLTLLGLPLAWVVLEAVSFHARHRNNGAIVSSGRQREYLLHVPTSYDPAKPAPLVISLHGAGLWPGAQRDISRWNELAESEGFIVVYPSGLDRAGPRIWAVDAGTRLDADIRYISELIDALEAGFHIDPERIFVNGLSNGGGMTFALSCTLSHRIAAFGMVGAAHLLPWSWCQDPPPAPMIAFHGTKDRTVPYAGGTSWVSPKPFPDIPTFTAHWARRNQCLGDPVETLIADDVMRLEYRRCADGNEVILYTLLEGGHTWPGSQGIPEWLFGKTTQSIDATRLMWEFFRDHPRNRSSDL